jgi:hypothetical protein
MFKVMAMLQTLNGSITRCVGEFGGEDGLQRAEDFRLWWAERPGTLTTWLA